MAELPMTGGWHCGRFILPLGRRTLVMGILNVTPDSFSGDAVFANVEAAVAHAEQMIADGADLLDVGGESTRPGAEAVSIAEELERVLPIVERLRTAPVPISVDTRKPEVAAGAIVAGASVINDVTALGDDAMVGVIAASEVGLVLMHMKGEPRTMQLDPHYDDVVLEVRDLLRDRAAMAERSGVARNRIAIDPGIGFGKTLKHNLELLRRLDEIAALGYPVLVGTSRKRFIGELTGAGVAERAFGTAASVALAIARGASVVRVHDAKEMKQVVAVADAIVRAHG
jgi:dihydropteroate synthase